MRDMDEVTLKQNIDRMTGKTLAELAEAQNITVPKNLLANKGWVGQLIELALGAESGNEAQPDFPTLGIELKTLPINAKGQPKESTFINTISLQDLTQVTWENSTTYQKLRHVLWVPIEAESSLPLNYRRVGKAFFWRPSAEQFRQLKQDWLELTERILLGDIESLSAREGVYLQVRPKGQNAKALCYAINRQGESYQTLPRGFYLRRLFTQMIYQEEQVHEFN